MSLEMESVKGRLLAAFRYLLKPLVRLAVKNTVSYPEFSNALKQAYVDVAARQIRASGKEPTAEGISLIANIETAAVQDVLRSDVDAAYVPVAQTPSPIPELLAAWHSEPAYTGPYGVVKDIPFSKADSSGREDPFTFTHLAAKYCPGIPAKEVLDELLRINCVVDVGNGYYRTIARSYIPEPLSRQNILLFARVAHNICETLEVNLRPESAGGQGLMERNIFTKNGLTQKDLQQFNVYLRERGQVFADDIDNWLSSHEKEDRDQGVKTGIGLYHYIINDEDERGYLNQRPIEGAENEH